MSKLWAILLIVLFPALQYAGHLLNGVPSSIIRGDTLTVTGGMISGHKTSDETVLSYLGIPFAAPPLGELRWQPPKPVIPWSGVRACDHFAPSAIQPTPRPFYMWSEEFLIPPAQIDEDCLYLNVWTPADRTDEQKPVIVWIHGGGFSSGGSAVPIYDGEALARKGVVFVSINYRVGIFGFFTHPELIDESSHNTAGNYGLLDQIAALKWVQQNIAHFGGDPENVTIAGQSAGAASVAYLVASPLAKGFFNKAIAQSGAGLFGFSPAPGRSELTHLTTAAQDGARFAQEIGAPNLAQLRALPADTLLQKARSRPNPIVDGYVLPEQVSDIYRSGRQNPVHLLTGWNKDEGMLFRGPQRATDYRADIEREWQGAAEALLKYYPAPDDVRAARSQRELQRDLVFGAQNYAMANYVSKQGSNVFVYRFTRDLPDGKQPDFGAFHTAEVPYALGNLSFVNRPFRATDHKLADLMSTYWTNFARTGSPNGEGIPEWPAYRPGDHTVKILGDTVHSAKLEDAERLRFLVEHFTRR